MLTMSKLGMRFGNQVLFEDVNINLVPKARYGLVGANGAGKSTLLQLVAGLEETATGEISYPKSAKVGWLKQDHFGYEDTRVLDVVIQGNPSLWQALQEKEALLATTAHDVETGLRLAELEEIILAQAGYEASSFAHILLTGLGLDSKAHLGPMSALSGGYKLRVLLAQVLFSKPDILLLDEPTNHLDIISIRWLAQFLTQQYQGVLLFVSHDRGFLDSVATHILDIDYHTILTYPGNYRAFIQAKAQAYAEQEKIQQNQQAKIDQLQNFVDRFGAKATKAKQAKSKQKQIERIEQVQLKPSTRKAPNFAFKQSRPAGKQVLKVNQLSKHFGDKTVLNQVSFNIARGEKVAIIGKNGLGKSTILKILVDQLSADEGEYEWGYACQIAYFAQDHHEILQEQSSDVLTWLEEQSAGYTSSEVRKTLGQFLFSGDSVYKSLGHLSGGEGARLLLAKMMLAEHNILILDEPTNHLDLEAMQALSEALESYPGTVLIVSHDSYFIERVAKRIIALTETGLRDYHGDYASYLQYYADEDETLARQSTQPDTLSPSSNTNQPRVNHKTAVINIAKLEKQVQRLQDEIETLESQIESIDRQFAGESFYQTASTEEVTALTRKKEELIAKLATAMNDWESLAKRLEDNL